MQAQLHYGMPADDGQSWQPVSRHHLPMLILPKHGQPDESQAQEIRRIQVRSERVFRVFIWFSALLAAVIVLVILLRWKL